MGMPETQFASGMPERMTSFSIVWAFLCSAVNECFVCAFLVTKVTSQARQGKDAIGGEWSYGKARRQRNYIYIYVCTVAVVAQQFVGLLLWLGIGGCCGEPERRGHCDHSAR